MAQVILYNIEKSKAVKIKMLCRSLNISAREAEESEFGKQISYLLGFSDDGASRTDETFSEEMLYIADLGSSLSRFLEQLRRKKVPVELKAVKTDTNVNFTSYELYRELSAERAALQSGRTAHEAAAAVMENL